MWIAKWAEVKQVQIESVFWKNIPVPVEAKQILAMLLMIGRFRHNCICVWNGLVCNFECWEIWLTNGHWTSTFNVFALFNFKQTGVTKNITRIVLNKNQFQINVKVVCLLSLQQ